MTPADLSAFTAEVARRFEAKEIRGPIHLNSPSQAEPLREIFQRIERKDWVLSNFRGHYHALLHGVPREHVMADILAGRSMALHYPKYRFMSSAIVGGMMPIACGLAAAGEQVWCFIGDMCHSTGAFRDAMKYARGHALSVKFVVEDNGLSTNTPTLETWGEDTALRYMHYRYERTEAHCGSGVYVQF